MKLNRDPAQLLVWVEWSRKIYMLLNLPTCTRERMENKEGSVRESDRNRKLTCVFRGLACIYACKAKFYCDEIMRRLCIKKIVRKFCFFVGMFFFWSPLSCLWDQVSSFVIGSLSVSFWKSIKEGYTHNTCWRWGLEWREEPRERERTVGKAESLKAS